MQLVVVQLVVSANANAQLSGVCNGADAESLAKLIEAIRVSQTAASQESLSNGLTSQHSATSRFHPATYQITPSNNDENLLAPNNANLGDDLLLDSNEISPNDDPLSGMGPNAAREAQRNASREQEKSYLDSKGIDPHAEAFANTLYPSAITCAKCHKEIYDEWRVSAHAYATISPMFQRFEEAISDLTRGTVGVFCLRCHAPVATQLKVPRYASPLEGPHVLREGVTCVACHRVVERYGRVNGERRIEPGSVYDPIVGNVGGDGVQTVAANPDQYKVRTSPLDKRPAQDLHRAAIQFEQLSDSSYCASCHQVVVQPGIALEIVYQQYRAGPACAKGISCQDCHMGIVPGKPLGYASGSIADLSGKSVRTDRKRANHMFHGPSYSLSHPAIFPHNEKLLRWKPADLIGFDWRNGWGSEAFERQIAAAPASYRFPAPWQNAQERRDAYKLVQENLALIDVKRQSSVATLELSSELKGPNFLSPPHVGQDLKFSFVVANTSEGHNMPSGSLGAQPQLWLNVVVIAPNGARIFESGDVDSYGDLRDVQSIDVQQRRLPPDLQLANYQTKFLITNVKGTDREVYFPVPVDIDPLPFFRPGPVPYTVLNHTPFARMEAHSIAPLDYRIEKFHVPGGLINQSGKYRISARLRSRVEPPYFARFVGLPAESIRLLNERIIDFHGQSFEFMVP